MKPALVQTKKSDEIIDDYEQDSNAFIEDTYENEFF
jgi:hypothetical protein